MTKHLAKSVMLMSMALVMAGSSGVCTYASEIPDTSFIVDYEEDMTYKKDIIIKVGDTLTLDKFDIKNSKDLTFEFPNKTYDEIGVYKEELICSDGTKLPFTVYVEAEGAFKIVGAKNITLTEGQKIDILKGVKTTKRAKIKVSKYDKTLICVPQTVTITATSTSGQVVKTKIKLLINNKPVSKMDTYVYARCNINMHIKPAYKTKNLGKIPYNTKVKVTGKIKVGKFVWYRVRYKKKTAFVFGKVVSSKKLPTIPTYIHEETDADYNLIMLQSDENMRESGKIDHNGNLTTDKGNIT